MRQAILCLALALATALAAAEPIDAWAGEWLDEDLGVAYRVEIVGGAPRVMRAIDKAADADRQVVRTQFTDGALLWTAYIAADDLLMEYRADMPADGYMKAAWASDTSSGKRTLRRSGWDGAWLDPENGVTSIIQYYLGAYVVSEVFGPDHANYAIQSYTCNGGTLTWTAKSARRTTLTYTALSRDIAALRCYWLNNHGALCERTLNLIP